ncbi:tryptophan-rich sensory protein [Rhodobacteraceae bacterium KMM 6894]|nr:tryptophan-rich sensory protein [Rhodobacteraceae bacterium KMM 6894]
MPFLVLLAALAFAISPFLTPGFGGFDPNQFPVPQNNPPVQPAGYAFGIWGLIYIWLIAGAAYGVWARRDDPEWQDMRLPLLGSLVVGSGWLAVANTSPIWATVLIWVMWGGAVLAVLRAPYGDRWLGRGPVGLYAGWLTAASCVSVGLMLAGYGWMAQVPAAMLSLALALGLTVLIMRQRPDALAYPLGVIWALIAVCVANAGGSLAVLGLAAIGALLLIALMGRHIRAS